MNHIYTTPGMFAPATIVEAEPQRKETSQSIRSKVHNHRFNPVFDKPISESLPEPVKHGLITFKFLGKFPALK